MKNSMVFFSFFAYFSYSEYAGKMETTITAEKEPGVKRNSTDLWVKNGFFISQVCIFFLEKVNLSESTTYYVNQGHLSYKDNEKLSYTDIFIIGQVTPLLNVPENLGDYELKPNEVKFIRLKYDTLTGQFLGLESSLGYMTVRGVAIENFFDCGYFKEKSKVLCSTHKKKIPNSFSTTIFNRHRIQFESAAFSGSVFSKVFFFLLSTTDRVGDTNQYLGSVNLSAIDIGISDFGPNFDPYKLDYNNPERENVRESVLNVLRKVVDLINQNLRRDADSFFRKASS